MGKGILFGMLWWITGSPFLAILILLAALYILDRRFVGIFPSLTRPFQIRGRLRRIQQELKLNPHHTSLKTEAARILIDLGKYAEAQTLLDDALRTAEDSADVWFDAGICRLKQGQLPEGETMILKAVGINPRVRYGEPYLRLAEAFAAVDHEKALGYLHKFRDIQSSSCEAYYRLGILLTGMNRVDEARQAFQESVEIYQSLPRYKRKSERRWAILSRLKR